MSIEASREFCIIEHISRISAASCVALRSPILSNSFSAMARMSEFIMRMRAAIAITGRADNPTKKIIRSLESDIFIFRPPLS